MHLENIRANDRIAKDFHESNSFDTLDFRCQTHKVEWPEDILKCSNEYGVRYHVGIFLKLGALRLPKQIYLSILTILVNNTERVRILGAILVGTLSSPFLIFFCHPLEFLSSVILIATSLACPWAISLASLLLSAPSLALQ